MQQIKTSNFRKFCIVGIILVALVLILSFSRGETKAGPIKIGFVGVLSGDAAIYGETEKNVTQMVVDKINSSDGINGRKIEMIYEDGKANRKDALSAAQKLINIDKVKVILGGVFSSETLAVASIAEPAKVLQFTAFSSSPAISSAGDYIFRNAPSDLDGGRVDAELLAKQYKKIAIISENTEYSEGLRNVLLPILADKGVTVVADEHYMGDTKDFRTILLKVKLANPEAIYFNPGTSPVAAGFLLKQARELGITAPAYFNFMMGSAEAIKTAGSYAEGVIYSDAPSLPESGKYLLEEYKAKFNSAPGSDYELGAAYDRIMIITQAIKKVGYDSTKIKDYLYSMGDYKGAIGTYHFDKNGDMVGTGFVHFIIKNGQKVPLNS